MSTNDYKQIATDFLMLAAKGKAREGFSKYVDNNFKHHNIYFKGDGESLMIAMEDNAKKNPGKIFEIKKGFARWRSGCSSFTCSSKTGGPRCRRCTYFSI